MNYFNDRQQQIILDALVAYREELENYIIQEKNRTTQQYAKDTIVKLDVIIGYTTGRRLAYT